MEQESNQNPEPVFTLIRAGEAQLRERDDEQRRYYFNDLIDLVLVTSAKKHCEPSHLHKLNQETYYVIRGELWMNIAGRDLHLYAGDLVVVPPGVCHRFETTGDEVIFLALKKEPGLKDKRPC